MQSNVSTQQLQNVSSLLQCLLKYVHCSLALSSSRSADRLTAVFEESFTHRALAAIQTSRAFQVLCEEAVKQQCTCRKKVGA